jgi:hypothetical protein
MSETRKCPALGAQLPNSMQVYFPTAQLPVYLRPLTNDENAGIERFAPEVAKGRDHFRLFRIFNANYSELINTISRSLRVGEMEDAEKVEFDRVLLNLLSSGRAITDHFTKYFSAKFGDTDRNDELKKYFSRLREESWAVAFIEDVRNFIQHEGLPIVDYNRGFSGTSVELKITVDAARLSSEKKDPRAWKYSKLNAGHGTIDFFAMVQEYYLRMTRDLANFLAKSFVPDFVEAHKFFTRLAAEVKKAVPHGKMIVLTEFESTDRKHKFSFVPYPEDVFRELGLSAQA